MNKLTVAIITRNRAKLLGFCLESLVGQLEMPLEVLLIDNASNDNTKDVVSLFTKKLPLRYIYEKKVGISYARNRALKEAKGVILAFIDDDCMADKNWTKNMISAHRKYPKASAILGGSHSYRKNGIINTLNHVYDHNWVLANVDINNYARFLDTKNVSIKLKQCKNIQFDTSFIRGSDLDFGYQLLEKGKSIIYYPKAKIYFRARSNIFQFLRQRFLVGAGDAKIEFKWGQPDFLPKFKAKRKADVLKFPMLTEMACAISRKTQELGNDIEKIKILNDYKRLEAFPKTEPSNSRKKLSISIMIITMDRYKDLARCLNSLAKQTLKPTEVIIVDASNDKKPQLINKFRGDLSITYIQEKRVGFGTQRNIALAAAKYDIGAIIDDDAQAQSDWCEKILEAHRKYPHAIAIQGRIVNHSNSFVVQSLEQVRSDNWILKNLDYFGKLFILIGNNSSYKVKLLRKYKIKFAQDYLHDKYGGEDVDLANQIILKGQTILNVPNILVSHRERGSFGPFLNQRYRIGCSASIHKRDWSDVELPREKFNGTLPLYLKFAVRYFLDLALHPALRGNIFHFFSAIPLFYLAQIANARGLSKIKKIFKNDFNLPEYLLIQKPFLKLDSLTVALFIKEGGEMFVRCLLSLAHQAVYPKEILIINSGLSNGVEEIVSTYQKILPLRYLHMPNAETSSVLNVALKKAEGEMVAFIDEGMVVPPDWIWRVFEGHQKYPQAIVIQGSVKNLPESTFPVIADFFYGRKLSREFNVKKRILSIRERDKNPRINVFDTKNVSFKLSKLKKLNLWFDSQMKHSENIDFAKRLVNKKKHIRYYPSAFVSHYKKDNLISFLSQGFQKGVGYEKYSKKWYKRRKLKKKSLLDSANKLLILCTFYNIYFKFLIFSGFFLYQGVFNCGQIYERIKSNSLFNIDKTYSQ